MGIGKLLIVLGICLLVAGVVFLLAERAGLGRMPGDIFVRGGRFTFYFPVVTCVVVSVVLSLVLWLLQWWRG